MRANPAHLHGVGEVVAIVDCEPRDGPQGPEVDLLALRLSGVVWSCPHKRGEVAYAVDGMTWEEEIAELTKIQPAIWRVAKATVVEVEGINVYVGRHSKREPAGKSGKKQGPPREAAPRPPTEASGEILAKRLVCNRWACQQLRPRASGSRDLGRDRLAL